MKAKYLYDHEIGDPVDSEVAIVKADIRTAANGKSYITLTLQDKSGLMITKYWNATDADLAFFNSVDFARVVGVITEYQGKKEIRQDAITPIDEPSDWTDFLPTAKRPIEDMRKELDGLIESVTYAPLRALLDTTIGPEGSVRAQYETAPAAMRRHHACCGGLIWHSLEVAQFADADAGAYRKMTGRLLFRDLMVTMALLHDIGKVYEISTDKCKYGMTRHGSALDHINLGLFLVRDTIRKIRKTTPFDEDLEIQVLHVIVSHHGKPEYGSIKMPQTQEADLIHKADFRSVEKYHFERYEEEETKLDTYCPELSGSMNVPGRFIYTGMTELMERLGV